MKNLIVVIYFTLMTLLFSEEPMPGELKISGLNSNQTITIIANGKVWQREDDNWEITNLNSYRNISLTGQLAYNLDFISDDGNSTGPDGTIGYAYYEISVGNYSFNFDYVDCDYANSDGSWGTHYNKKDIWIEWTGSQFKRKKYGTGWDYISNNSTIGIWDSGYKDSGYPPNFEKFQPTDPSNLTKLNNYNNHPQFSWTGSSAPVDPNNSSLITYNVWRKSGFGSFQQIASALTTTTYIDNSVLLNQQGIRHEYRINANSGDNNIQSPFYSNKIFYNGWLGKEQQEQFLNQIEGFDSKTITTSTMSVKLTNINALDWYTTGDIGISWLNGNHDIVFTHGIWLSGMIGDTLIGTTSSWGLDYSPGPIIDGQAAMIVQPENSNSYRIYHIDQNSGPGNPDYDEWPVQWGAPDNPDGSPKVYGDQTAYMVYNDAHPSDDLRGFPQSDPTPIEIHETVWDHSTDNSNENEAELENVIFFRYQLYNRGNNDINDAALALWTDIDLYWASDNWGGYNANGNYVYNYFWADDEEGYLPRACTYVLLQGPLVSDNGETGIAFGKEFADKSNLNTTAGWYIVDDSFPVGNGDVFGVFPDELEQLSNISLGLMPNGDPIIHPITGDTTTYTHDGNPATGDGWLWDYGSGGGSGFISSSSTFELPAGDSTEGIYALVVALGDSFSEALINLEDQVLDLKEWWVDNQLSIYDDEKESIPEFFQLFNAYPNPFNASINIQWQTSFEKNIEINVYNLLGQKVANIYSGLSNNQLHEIKWQPEQLSSGVYILELTDNIISEHQKIILLK